MTTTTSLDHWQLARAALHSESERFRSILRASPDPRAPVTDQWTVADTAAHLVTLHQLCLSLVGDPEAAPPPGLDDLVARTNVDTVTDFNRYVMGHLRERDPDVLDDWLARDTARLLAATDGAGPDAAVSWLAGSRVPVRGLVGHLVNELQVHGWDIARAVGQPWPMSDPHAALFWELFFLGMLRSGQGLLLDTGARQPRRPVAVQFRSAFTSTATLVLEGGQVRIAPAATPFDARVTFRPAQFNLMLFGRISTLHAAARRYVVVDGPRLWRLPGFLRVVHVPNPRRVTRREAA